MLEYKKLKTPVGKMVLVADQKAIVMFGWEDFFAKEASNKEQSKWGEMKPNSKNTIIAKAEKQLEEYFKGKRKSFDLPLAPEGTEFQKSVWRELSKISYGETISYGEQAKRIGKPKAMRAVGGANGKNPIAIIVPCHRVIGANGTLTGFGGGLKAKTYLLELESRAK